MKSIAAIGMFDGVHLGHRAILSALLAQGAATGRRPVVFTFAAHPRETITGEAMPLITPPDLKRELIEEAYGLPVNVMNFSKDDFAMPAAAFLRRLGEFYGVEALVMGYDNRIGSDHMDARSLVGDLGVEVYPVGRFTTGDYQPSSSAIRNAVSAGDIAAVRAMLGHEYTVRGKVVEGNRVGRTIGFPTANIELSDPRQLLPPTAPTWSTYTSTAPPVAAWPISACDPHSTMAVARPSRSTFSTTTATSMAATSTLTSSTASAPKRHSPPSPPSNPNSPTTAPPPVPGNRGLSLTARYLY